MMKHWPALVAAVALLGPIQPARAQPFPGKTVHIVNPYAAGGSGDIVARILADSLADQWGVPVVVENRPGAGGLLGTLHVQRSPGDGYTLLLASPSFVMSPVLRAEARYDPAKDFVAVTRVATSPLVVAVHEAFEARSLGDLLELARKAPGRLTYAAVGPGTVPHLVGEMLRLDAKVDWIYAPYQGGAPAVIAVLGGHVSVVVANYAELRSYIAAGKMRALAVGSSERLEALPRVPTLAERGHDAIEGTIWFGLVAPGGTPREVAQRIAASVRRALESQAVRDKLVEQGLLPMENSPEEFAAFLGAQGARFEKVIRRAGIKVD
jgi:tripartite-type tricarboxylate transporter receptor subunit TctC